MAIRRDILIFLTRDELIDFVEYFRLGVKNLKSTDLLIEALAASKRATLTLALPRFTRARLKQLCRALGLEDSSRTKASLVERLAASEMSSSAGSVPSPSKIM